jgi:hypothetical protein
MVQGINIPSYVDPWGDTVTNAWATVLPPASINWMASGNGIINLSVYRSQADYTAKKPPIGQHRLALSGKVNTLKNVAPIGDTVIADSYAYLLRTFLSAVANTPSTHPSYAALQPFAGSTLSS